MSAPKRIMIAVGPGTDIAAKQTGGHSVEYIRADILDRIRERMAACGLRVALSIIDEELGE